MSLNKLFTKKAFFPALCTSLFFSMTAYSDEQKVKMCPDPSTSKEAACTTVRGVYEGKIQFVSASGQVDEYKVSAKQAPFNSYQWHFGGSQRTKSGGHNDTLRPATHNALVLVSNQLNEHGTAFKTFMLDYTGYDFPEVFIGYGPRRSLGQFAHVGYPNIQQGPYYKNPKLPQPTEMKILLNGKERSFDFYRKGKFEQSIWNTIEIQNAPINTTVGNAHYSKINDPETHGHDGSHINLFLELVDNPYEKMSEFERYTQIYRATLNAVESNNAEASLNWISSHSSMTMESINGAHLNKGRLDLNVKVDMPPSAMLCRIERVKASRIPSFKRRIETGAIVKRTDDYQIRHGVSICDETRGENPMTISRLDDLFNSSLMDSLSEQYPQHYISNLESLGSEKVKMIVCRGDIPKSRQDYYRQCRKLEIENSHPVADQANWTVTDDREIFPDPLN